MIKLNETYTYAYRYKSYITYFKILGLKPIEKAILTDGLCKDAGVNTIGSKKRIICQEMHHAFKDPQVYFYAAIGISILGLIKYLTALIPLLIQKMTLCETEKYLTATPPSIMGCIFCFAVGYSASHFKERSLHLLVCLIIDIIGVIMMTVLHRYGVVAEYIGLCVSYCGTFGSLPMLLSWLTGNIHGNTKRATAVAFVLGIGQLIGCLTVVVSKKIVVAYIGRP